jgi:NADH-quinone oxidoreductase subunit E
MVIESKVGEKPGFALIDAIVHKHNIQPGAVIPILQEIQDAYGYVPPVAITRISENIGVSASDIYGIVTFYSQFRLQPVGKHIIKVCHGTACHLNGAERIAHALAHAAGAEEGETSPDDMITVERVACIGCCSRAPCVMVDGEVHGRLSSKEVDGIVTMLKKAEESQPVE